MKKFYEDEFRNMKMLYKGLEKPSRTFPKINYSNYNISSTYLKCGKKATNSVIETKNRNNNKNNEIKLKEMLRIYIKTVISNLNKYIKNSKKTIKDPIYFIIPVTTNQKIPNTLNFFNHWNKPILTLNIHQQIISTYYKNGGIFQITKTTQRNRNRNKAKIIIWNLKLRIITESWLIRGSKWMEIGNVRETSREIIIITGYRRGPHSVKLYSYRSNKPKVKILLNTTNKIRNIIQFSPNNVNNCALSESRIEFFSTEIVKDLGNNRKYTKLILSEYPINSSRGEKFVNIIQLESKYYILQSKLSARQYKNIGRISLLLPNTKQILTTREIPAHCVIAYIEPEKILIYSNNSNQIMSYNLPLFKCEWILDLQLLGGNVIQIKQVAFNLVYLRTQFLYLLDLSSNKCVHIGDVQLTQLFIL